MDPITHMVVGVALATLSDSPVTLTNPIYVGAALGSLAPDIDILYRVKGEIEYLRQHRGVSHSLLGITGLASLITLMLVFLHPESSILTLFISTLLGTISHIALDYLNPHGIQALWPLNRKRYHWSLLNGVDPFLIGLSLIIILIHKYYPTVSEIMILGYVGYVLFRWWMSKKVYLLLKRKFENHKIEKIITMPSLLSLWKWDFIIENGKALTTGEVKYFSQSFRVIRTLKKYEHKIISKALNSSIGKLFCDFTPYVYICPVQNENNEKVLEFIDLRYRLKKDFLHSAVIVYNNDDELEKAVFHPFSKKRKIQLVG